MALDRKFWRSFLFVPAVNDRFIESAIKRSADVLLIDLEDSVGPDDKELARQKVRTIAAKFSQAGRAVAVRINRQWNLAIKDIESSVCSAVNALVLPKVPDASYVRYVDEVLGEFESQQGLANGHTGLVVMVEDAEGLQNMSAIAAAGPRVLGLIVGAEDLAVSMQMAVSEDSLYVPNVLAVAACRRANIKPIGFVGSVADFNDPADFRRKIARAAGLGFEAAFCIHPTQVEIVNEEFTPKAAAVSDAQALIDEFERQMSLGRAACTFRGRMVDLPVVEQARQLVRRFNAYQTNE